MSDGPFIAFYPSDWLAGTRGLSASETGIYITLIAMMYERGEPLSQDDARLARLCGLPKPSFLKAISVLIDEGKIERSDRGYWNNRVSVELKRRENIRSAASKAAKTRWEKSKQNQGDGDADAMHTLCGNHANQNQNHTTTLEDKSSNDADASKAVDLTALVWQTGKPFLQSKGVKNPGPVIGRFLKAASDSASEVLRAIEAAQKSGTQDPVPFIFASLKANNRKRPNAPPKGYTDGGAFGMIPERN